MFGQMPMSRWKHSMVSYFDEQTSRDGFMIFGGTNLNCYCRSKIFTFTLINKNKGVKKPNKELNTGENFTDPTSVGISAPSSFTQLP